MKVQYRNICSNFIFVEWQNSWDFITSIGKTHPLCLGVIVNIQIIVGDLITIFTGKT